VIAFAVIQLSSQKAGGEATGGFRCNRACPGARHDHVAASLADAASNLQEEANAPLRHRAHTLDPMGDGFDLTASLVGEMLASRLPEREAVIYDEKCGELRVPDTQVARHPPLGNGCQTPTVWRGEF
jgi:hypothetical protein